MSRLHGEFEQGHLVRRDRYGDGRIVRDETTTSPRYAINGNSSDEITSVRVKSATTTAPFTCSAASSLPTAVLELATPAVDDPFAPGCSSTFGPPELYCGTTFPRMSWAVADTVAVAGQEIAAAPRRLVGNGGDLLIGGMETTFCTDAGNVLEGRTGDDHLYPRRPAGSCVR